MPHFTDKAKTMHIDGEALTIFYSTQCPFIANCIEQVSAYCANNGMALDLREIDTLQKAKEAPCVFNNWAVFYKGKYIGVHLLNEGLVKKVVGK